MNPVTVKAFAKINIGLFLTGKRPDGYHTLETVFAPVNWYDTLEFTSSGDVLMSCSDASLPVDDGNLCVRAARLLQQHTGTRRGVAIHLQKVLPFGAGLGGGSSDAAVVLRTLNRLWELSLPSAELHALAVRLGADVPYFLEMSTMAYAGGIGDELEELPLTLPYYIVTVFPDVHISTAWAYRNFYPRFGRPVPDLRRSLNEICTQGREELLQEFENDFQPAVFDHYPAVMAVWQQLVDAGAVYASLSGSGSALFGFFTERSTAEQAMAILPVSCPKSLTAPGFVMEH